MMTKLVHEMGFAFDWTPHVKEVCRPGAGAETCRYLTGDIFGGDGGLHCAKFNPPLAARINRRVADGTFTARGDNCPGRPVEDVL